MSEDLCGFLARASARSSGLDRARDATVLVRNVAFPHFLLELGTDERRVDEDETAQVRGAALCGHGRGHAAHRMTDEDRSPQLQVPHEAEDIVRKFVVAVSKFWCGRPTMASRVRHDDVEITLESLCQRCPGRPATHQTVKQDDGLAPAPGADEVNPTAVRFARPVAPRLHPETMPPHRR